MTLNGSLFYADIDNLGVNVDAGDCSSRVAISVPEAHTMGGELELSVHPTDALLVTFAGSYVEAEFDSTVPDTVNGGAIARHQGRQPHPVRTQLAALRGGDVHVPGSLAVKGELRHRLLAIRRQIRSPSPATRSPGAVRHAHAIAYDVDAGWDQVTISGIGWNWIHTTCST